MFERHKATIGIIFVGIVLRILSATGDLWLDEIWSIRLVSKLSNCLEIFTLKHDNNHPLNSLWMYWIGAFAEPLYYRSLALVCGCFSLVVLAWIGPKLIEKEVSKLILFFYATSYVFTLYDSEARGYGPMISVAIISCAILFQLRSSTKIKYLLCYWLLSAVGVLSHLTYIELIFTYAVVDGLILFKRHGYKDALLAHVPPLVFSTAFLLYWFNGMVVGGGVMHASIDSFVSLLSIGFGGGELPGASTVESVIILTIALIAYLLACGEAFVIFKKQRSFGVGLICILIVAPVVLIFSGVLRTSAPRFFLPTLLAAYVCVASLLLRLWRRDKGGRVIASLLLLFYCAGSSVNLTKLIKYGRGQYAVAMNYLLNSSKDDVISISTQQEFRVRTVIEYYLEANHKAPTLNINPSKATNDLVLIASGDEYPDGCKVINSFPSAPLSGFNWLVARCD